MQCTSHQPKFFIQLFTAQGPLHKALKMQGWNVCKSPSMWRACSPHPSLILWNFSFRLTEVCLRCECQAAYAGAAGGRRHLPEWEEWVGTGTFLPPAAQWSSDVITYRNHLEGSTPGVSGSVGLGRGLRSFLSNRFPGDAGAASVGPHVKNHSPAASFPDAFRRRLVTRWL